MAGRCCPWALLLCYSFSLLLFKISLSLLSVTSVVSAEYIVFIRPKISAGVRNTS